MSCPDCFRGSLHTNLGQPTDKSQVLDVHGLTCYVALPPIPMANKPQSTIIYLPDAFGWQFINNQLLADAYAKETGFRVIIPDIINGGPLNPIAMQLMDAVSEPVKGFNVWAYFKKGYTLVKLLAIVLPFMMRSSAYKTYPKLLEFARRVKADLPPGAKLGVCGFCWGGLPSTLLCAEPLASWSQDRLIDAHFAAHPSRLGAPKMVVDAIEKFKVPYSLAAAEEDPILTPDKIENLSSTLESSFGPGDGGNGFNYEIVVYPRCQHGFAIRAKEGDEDAAICAKEAQAQAVRWFQRWL
ncbi:hypothetical protein COCC4DRAFT_27921 [Bipolaris maydis ATCC 48331]|uniref:Dienelactone hydrolase domain-containing protein n=2 Tax=Cochliobolus heterostrophus TaxID=5016 RepID=M2UCD1_COCH5|nr:uncharacterized protein COCC4DRAFT_27921 [Bipolaris maydis ATCC 48331]EMD85572.1 hypothetical protein COCHEDRAFT_1118277 [Bipolaris maydis C5]KAH7559090.1 hypothetical protein BM1_04027 [Bipolaris maydis]ENH99975.1 hypothetical protein COCC4DRAFT_27921 [Bipolaris maydis ATCC 48331]KAJ5021189.1 Alpha/Beta hydrolase protein [Bipolaris maydis]KAJ5055523.1 Alpha/Beta hydrolase protein [Bipolaris maydis]